MSGGANFRMSCPKFRQRNAAIPDCSCLIAKPASTFSHLRSTISNLGYDLLLFISPYLLDVCECPSLRSTLKDRHLEWAHSRLHHQSSNEFVLMCRFLPKPRPHRLLLLLSRVQNHP